MIPTLEQLLDLFAVYNERVWPMQIVAYLLGVAGFVLAFRKSNLSSRLIPAILAFFWLWVAFVFWLPNALGGFTPGYLFAGFFLIQGLLFLIQVVRPKLVFGYQASLAVWLGIFFMLYALVGYPLLGVLVGHVYPYAPPFGLTPCPLITFSFGLFLLTVQKVPNGLMIIPFCYALSGILWASMGVWEDIGMVLSGLLGIGLIWARDAKSAQSKASPESSETGWSLDLADRK